jgi:1-acyl-sn-glycerol-3-phosphate acyltransferase
VIVVRSIIYNVLFYLNLGVLLLVALLTLLLPRRAVLKMAELWGRTSVWMLRVVCGTRMEIRGLEHLAGRRLQGPFVIAAKHQSTWETFALLKLFDDFTFIVNAS